MRLARISSAVFAVAVLTISIAPTGQAETAAPCSWEIEYELAASLKLTDTPMGEGDGIYRIGPGSVVLRYENRGGRPGGDVKMLRYAMRESFTIRSKTLFWTTTAITDTNTAATPDPCGIAAEGAIDARRTIRWRTPLRGYHTDGTLTCDGSLCGKFGAPPQGQMPLHIGPSAVWFSPFVFAPDMQTFTMATTHVSKTSMPKQSGEVALSGRERRRACVPVAPCAR